MSVISDYQDAYGSTLMLKPIDASISGQSASVDANGLVRVNFASSDSADIVALIGWLTALLAG